MSNVPNLMFQPTKAQILKQQQKNASTFLFLVAIFTLLSVLSLLFSGSFYFLVSATVPSIIVSLGMVLCGILPDEEYVGDLSGMRIFDKSAFTIFIIIAVVIIALYFVSAILSRKEKVGWLIFSLVFFSLDTILMIIYFGFQGYTLINLIFHAGIIIFLIVGIKAHYEFKKLPPEEQNPAPPTNNENTNEPLEDSPILRPADLSIKSRILLDHNYQGHQIVYRRYKKTNELVIDGNVYAEYTAKLEFDHSLVANLDGHTIIAGLYSMGTRSFIAIDGILIKQKLRWY